MESTHYDVIVIGGGASGMMAAGTACLRRRADGQSLRVLLLEKNPNLGQKLSITGGGRCNITNAEFDIQKLLQNYGPARDFLFSAFSQFGVADTIAFFESRGLPIIVQDRKRAFPSTQRATDVVAVMAQYVNANNVTVQTGTRVQRFQMTDNHITGVVTDHGLYTATSYILATGGMSHPEIGSTGDGFDFLRAIGHTVHTPTPTIVPLAVAESWVQLLQGVSFADVKIHYYCDTVKKFSKRGPLLFTHFGISGPTVLNSAGAVSGLLHTGTITTAIDLFPNMDAGALEQFVLSIFDTNKNKTFKNIIKSIIGAGDSDAWLNILQLYGASSTLAETKVHSVSREDRKLLVRILKALPLTITGLMGFDRAVVADGGVVLTEIDMRTMRSIVHPNLFITGDLLHINRPSGGYSLQLCWTTGYVAGMNAGM